MEATYFSGSLHFFNCINYGVTASDNLTAYQPKEICSVEKHVGCCTYILLISIIVSNNSKGICT
jgi:hypothetical protein